MTTLSNAVLPLIRTRADVWRWSVANTHGSQMHRAVDALEAARNDHDPADVHAVTHKALARAITVIAKADDSSGIVGDACRRILALHPQTAAAAGVPHGTLIDWMVTFQFDGKVDYFELDPVAYAPALGDAGIKLDRDRLAEVEAGLGTRPSEDQRWSSPHSHAWFVLDWNAQRLAVLDHDIEAIIRTHAKDRRVAARLENTAKAFEEIGEYDLAIDWAKQATDSGPSHQARKAADRWCRLLDQHHPAEALDARMRVFRRWPSPTTATRLRDALSGQWPDHREQVLDALKATPSDAVMFVLRTLNEPGQAWELAHELALDDDRTWSKLLNVYGTIDPVATIPVHQRLVAHELGDAGAQHYRVAARRLATMRTLAAGTVASADVDQFIADLRETHRRRPRLQQEFDRAGLP